MGPPAWLVVHLVSVAVPAGVGWVVQLVVYPAFRLVGAADWANYHAAHTMAITRVVALPRLVQGMSTAALPRANLVRTLAWTGSTVVAAALL